MKSLNPNDLGKKYLVEECQKIQIREFLRTYRRKLREWMISSELDISGLKIELATSKTHYNGIRFWFKCPLCSRRAGVLFRKPLGSAIGCRRCFNLGYRKQRYKGMAEGEI